MDGWELDVFVCGERSASRDGELCCSLGVAVERHEGAGPISSRWHDEAKESPMDRSGVGEARAGLLIEMMRLA
jgi:hypothetical protein